jgi:hypothetical protein
MPLLLRPSRIVVYICCPVRESPTCGRLAPVVVIHPREGRARSNVSNTLVGNEYHGACPGDICGQRIKQRPGLIVTAGELSTTCVQSLGSPCVNGRARLEADCGGSRTGDEDLEHPVLNEQLGKAFGILAAVCIRILRDDLLDSQLIFDAHLAPF